MISPRTVMTQSEMSVVRKATGERGRGEQMEEASDFETFLTAIRPTKNQKDGCIKGHRTLRSRLLADETLAPSIVSTFLQGSHRRATAVRPRDGRRSDVDIVVVTRLCESEYTPAQALELFEPFLDTHYKGKWESQGRSYGIKLSHVDLDLVPTSAPSASEIGILESLSVTAETVPQETDEWHREVEAWLSPEEQALYRRLIRLAESKQQPAWMDSPLRIPDRDAERWEDTHPLEQIHWTWAKNAACNGHYVNVVKAIKWWQRTNPDLPRYPKGYPIEHLVGACCPEGITSVAQGVTLTLEQIASLYRTFAALKITPSFADHGVPGHNVFKRVTGEDFATFHAQVSVAAEIARRALDAGTERESSLAWTELLGNKFPEPTAATTKPARATLTEASARARGASDPPTTRVGFGSGD